MPNAPAIQTVAIVKHRVLISDKFDDEGISRLKQETGLEVVYKGGHTREELLASLSGVEGLIIRSATRVDQDVLLKAPDLKIVVRAGVGVDNIDIPAASRAGVIVMNAPGGNSVSTAEHAVALMMASARHVAQADASMKAGQWEKKKFKGVELKGKVLGVMGLGRIGKEVVSKARGLGMEVIGFDPFIPEKNLADLEIEIVDREALIRRSDFITVHTPLTATTKDFLSKENLAAFKKGVRLINCARGGIYNEEALALGLESGHIASAALDVFTEEPIPADFPLRRFENCILTPHLGASTDDAEFAVAMETVDQLLDFFHSGVARNALNFPTLDPSSLDFLKPYFEGGEKVGRILAESSGGDINAVEINYRGEIAEYMIQPVTTAILRGALRLALGDEVNYVNAPVLARDRGIRVSEEKVREGRVGLLSSVQAVMRTGGGREVELTFTAINKSPMVVSMFGLPIEFKPEGILLIIENKDVPKVVGQTGMFLGDRNINIASLELSRDERGGTARCVIAVDDLLGKSDLQQLAALDNVLGAVQVDLRS